VHHRLTQPFPEDPPQRAVIFLLAIEYRQQPRSFR
jgi:hypothetical protein